MELLTFCMRICTESNQVSGLSTCIKRAWPTLRRSVRVVATFSSQARSHVLTADPEADRRSRQSSGGIVKGQHNRNAKMLQEKASGQAERIAAAFAAEKINVVTEYDKDGGV